MVGATDWSDAAEQAHNRLAALPRRFGGVRPSPAAGLVGLALVAIAATTPAAATPSGAAVLPVAQSGFCSTPFIGDLATWGTPKLTKALMIFGGVVVAYGIFGAPAEGRGRLSLRSAVGIGLIAFFMGLTWGPTWSYVGSDIFGGSGATAAMTCGMGG